MSRAARTTALAFACSVAMPVLAQTTTGAPPAGTQSQPSYEAETPLLLGSFLEPRATAAPTDVRDISQIVVRPALAKSREDSTVPPVETPQKRE